MTMNTSQALLNDWYKENEDKLLEGFMHFLRFKSISTDPDYKEDLLECADFVEEQMTSIGFTVERWPTSGYPTLYGEWLGAGADKPTILIYNHYDVQPVDPIELWDSPPFEPEVRAGEVYARGAQDNKGQCYYTLQSLRALMQRDGKFPVNIKLCIEGEEECGSSGLAGILEERREQLSADYLLVVDVGLQAADAPSITLGARGMVSMDIEVLGSKIDMHSGSHGGVAYNPNHALAEILAQLRDSEGRVRVPGFYDEVVEMDEAELSAYSFAMSEEEYLSVFGTKPSGGEDKYAFGLSGTVRPTVEINGMGGGYTGAGFKTVIPAKAIAKISCRLVPDQQPDLIGKRVADYLQSLAPEGIEVRVDVHSGGGIALRSSPDSKVAQAFRSAYQEVFNKPCASILEGGSIPIAADLAKVAGAETLLIGLGLPDDNIHAPNEHFGLERLRKGFLIVARGLEHLGA